MIVREVSRKALFVALAFTLTLPISARAYNKSWDQGHQCINTLPGASGWGRYGYDTTGPDDYRGGNYSTEDCCKQYCQMCPVYANTGRLLKTFTDLTVPGVGPSLTISRTYLSQDWANTLFGRGWIFNFGKRLIVTRDGNGEKILVVRRSMGEQNFFKEQPDGTLGLLAHYGVPYNLTKNPDGGYVIAEKNGTVQRIDAAGTLIEIFDKNGNRLSFTYNAVGCLSRITNASGNYVDFVLGPNGKIASISDNVGRTVQYTYDTNGNLISVADPMGNVTQYAYDGQNRLTSITDPRGNTVLSVTYDNFQPPRIATFTEKGETWTITYYNGYTVKRDSGGRTWTYYYNNVGIIEKVIDPLGNETEQSHNHVTSTSMEWEEDANGNRTTYTYDADGNVTGKTDPLGHTWQYTYMAGTNRVETETDPLGLVTKYQYDANGNLTKVIRDFGGTLENARTYTYDARGNQTSAADPLGNVTQYQYDDHGSLTRMTDPLGHATTYTYDSRNNRLTQTDALGNTTTYTYDLMGNMLTITNALGNTTTYAYDGNGNRTSERDAAGSITTFAYDAWNRMIQVTDALGNSMGYTYDSVDNQTSVTDARGNMTAYAYDALGRLIRETDALGGQTNYTYDVAGKILTVTDACGNTTTFTYDALGRRLSESNAAGETITYAYDALGNIMKTTLPNGNATSRSYDALGRLVRLSDDLGLKAEYTYDLLGRLLTEADALGNTTTQVYDALGRVTQTTDAMGNSVVHTYDSLGRLATVADRAANTARYTYDGIGRRLSVTDAIGGTTGYTYDAVGNLTSIVDAHGNSIGYGYDALGRRIRETYADGTTRSFGYDAAGNLISRTDQKGQATTYAYDALNRQTTIDYPGANDSRFSYDRVGNLATADNSSATVSLTYDNVYRLTQSVQNAQTVTYAYDVGAGTRTVTYPGGQIAKEIRDARGRLMRIEDASAQPIIAYVYDAANRIRTRAYANGVAAALTCNTNGWITQVTCDRGGSRLIDFQYGFDKEGNRLYSRKLHDTGNSEQYTYDVKYQLIQFKRGSLDASGTVAVPVTQTSYNLDAVGNWTSKTTDSVTQNRTHNNMNELVSIAGSSLTYDDNGNLLDDGTNAYEYDYENRLIKVTRESDSVILGEYKYDALGRRVEKTALGTTTRFYYEGTGLIEERVGDTTQATYYYGEGLDDVVAMNRGGQVYYYHTNTLGSVVAMTDGAGNIVEQYSYDAFGNPETPSTIANPFLFTASYRDSESGLQFSRLRYMSHSMGRWTTRDPIGQLAGTNMYAYVSNNPINKIDPFGLKESIPWDDYFNDFLKKNPQLTDAQKRWVEKQLARGCVGVTVANIGKVEDMTDCYKTKAQAENRKNSIKCPCGVAVFSTHLWNDTGRDGVNPDVTFDATTGKADLTNWDVKGRPKPGGGTYVNFDYGYLDASGKMIHADLYHNPDKNGDGLGDYYPGKPIREAKIFKSSFSEWQTGAPNYYQYSDFNAEVWCVTCKSNDFK